jgi:hypothetical protein
MKKLLIINGAGASIDFGMPTVKNIDEWFEQWALETVPLSLGLGKSLYIWAKEQLKEYCRTNPNNWEDKILNFENLLYTLQLLGELENDRRWKRHNNRINPFVTLQPFPMVRRFGKEKAADGDDFHFLHGYLIDKLLTILRKRCASLDVDKPDQVHNLRQFLTMLQVEFDLGILNLNYDNVLLTAMPDLQTGFDKVSGMFDRAQLYDDHWNFCYHLHGSVHFDMRGGVDTEMHKIVWNKDLRSQFAGNSIGRSGNFSGEGIMHLNSSIIAGLDKANQLLREPFAEYFMQIGRLVYEADAILFMGYGFSDWHLNRLFSFIRYDKSKQRKVVILDWASDTQDGLHFRHDPWSLAVFETVPFNGREMGSGTKGFSEPNPAIYYKKRKAFEISANSNYPLAVWYNGMLDACQTPERFLQQLR